MIYFIQTMLWKHHSSQATPNFSVSIKSIIFGLTILKCLKNNTLKCC